MYYGTPSTSEYHGTRVPMVTRVRTHVSTMVVPWYTYTIGTSTHTRVHVQHYLKNVPLVLEYSSTMVLEYHTSSTFGTIQLPLVLEYHTEMCVLLTTILVPWYRYFKSFLSTTGNMVPMVPLVRRGVQIYIISQTT